MLDVRSSEHIQELRVVVHAESSPTAALVLYVIMKASTTTTADYLMTCDAGVTEYF